MKCFELDNYGTQRDGGGIGRRHAAGRGLTTRADPRTCCHCRAMSQRRTSSTTRASPHLAHTGTPSSIVICNVTGLGPGGLPPVRVVVWFTLSNAAMRPCVSRVASSKRSILGCECN